MTLRRSSGRALRTASIWPWLTITCCWRPTPVSESSSWMSRSRQGTPLMAYSLSPERNSVRVMVSSVNSTGMRPAELSMVSDTSARPRAGRLADPAKMTSSIFCDRRLRGPWAPSTHATASTMFDLPLPLGPTTTVMPGSNSSVVVSAKDLNPLTVRDFRNTRASGYRRRPAGPRTPLHSVPGRRTLVRRPGTECVSDLALGAGERGAGTRLGAGDGAATAAAGRPLPVVDLVLALV